MSHEIAFEFEANEEFVELSFPDGTVVHIDREGVEEGIRLIYGMTGAESIPVLEKAVAHLNDDVPTNYWEAAEGNAKRPRLQLIAMARMRPDGIWGGD